MKTTIRDGKTYAKLKDLHLWEKNPREASKENLSKLKELIQKLGVFKPLLVTPEGEIIGGNQRYKCYKELKIDEIWINIVDPKNDAEKLEYALSDNQSAGRYIEDQLQQLVLEAKDVDLALFELDLGPLTSLSDFMSVDLTKPEAQEDEFDADSAAAGIKKPTTELGDLYLIDGKHRLLCGDSTDYHEVIKLIHGSTIDMVYTDPPYGINLDPTNNFTARSRKAKGNNFPKIHGDDSIDTALSAWNVCSQLKIPIQVWWGANYYCHHLPLTANWLVWDKREEDKERDNNSDGELAWVQCKRSSLRIFRHKWKGMIKASEHGQGRVHPTQKPIALAEWCIDEYCPEAKIILDLFTGSGSSLIACENKKKIFFGCELDPIYCDVILERYKKLKPNAKIEKIK